MDGWMDGMDAWANGSGGCGRGDVYTWCSLLVCVRVCQSQRVREVLLLLLRSYGREQLEEKGERERTEEEMRISNASQSVCQSCR